MNFSCNMYNGTFYIDTCKSYACKGIKTQIQSLPSKLSPFFKKPDGNASYFCKNLTLCYFVVNIVNIW